MRFRSRLLADYIVLFAKLVQGSLLAGNARLHIRQQHVYILQTFQELILSRCWLVPGDCLRLSINCRLHLVQLRLVHLLFLFLIRDHLTD